MRDQAPAFSSALDSNKGRERVKIQAENRAWATLRVILIDDDGFCALQRY
jgi:hypothetical protein